MTIHGPASSSRLALKHLWDAAAISAKNKDKNVQNMFKSKKKNVNIGICVNGVKLHLYYYYYFFTKDVEWISASLKLSRRRALADWKQGRLQLILALPVLDLGCQTTTEILF